MKTLAIALVALVGFTVAGISTSSLPTIPPESTWAAWEFWKPAEEAHEYFHHAYGTSFGSHGLDVNGLQLHEDLHNWERGLATEAEVSATWAKITPALVTFRTNLEQAGLLKTGNDPRGEQIFARLQSAYQTLRVQMANVKP